MLANLLRFQTGLQRHCLLVQGPPRSCPPADRPPFRTPWRVPSAGPGRRPHPWRVHSDIAARDRVAPHARAWRPAAAQSNRGCPPESCWPAGDLRPPSWPAALPSKPQIPVVASNSMTASVPNATAIRCRRMNFDIRYQNVALRALTGRPSRYLRRSVLNCSTDGSVVPVPCEAPGPEYGRCLRAISCAAPRWWSIAARRPAAAPRARRRARS